MAGSSKKPKKPSGDDSTNTSDSENESDNYNGQQEIQATFEGRNLEAHDFYGIKQLLGQLFLTFHIDLSQITNILISQSGIGSVLKQSLNDSDDEDEIDMTDDSEVFGVTSIINLTSLKETACIKEFFNLINEMIETNTDVKGKAFLKGILDSGSKLGFLINERFINIPAQISISMLGALRNELDKMKKVNVAYNFDYIILISKTWKPKDGPDLNTIFSNEEEEIFSKESDYCFEFCVENKTDTGISGRWKNDDTELIPYRQLILFKANKLSDIVQKITNFIQINN